MASTPVEKRPKRVFSDCSKRKRHWKCNGVDLNAMILEAMAKSWAQSRFELETSCTQSRNHTPRPLSHLVKERNFLLNKFQQVSEKLKDKRLLGEIFKCSAENRIETFAQCHVMWYQNLNLKKSKLLTSNLLIYTIVPLCAEFIELPAKKDFFSNWSEANGPNIMISLTKQLSAARVSLSI